MAEIPAITPTASKDAFAPIAAHYDTLMEHVDYGRWLHVALALGEMLPRPLVHLDVGCGTGIFMQGLDGPDWKTTGMDLSRAMVRVAREQRRHPRLAQADMRRPPFHEQFHLVSCLFDSLNFLLHEEHVEEALRGMANALKPGGLLYFDVVTARMVSDHFDNEAWTEHHGRVKSAWRSKYDKSAKVCATGVRVNAGVESVTYERVYPLDFLADAVARAGLSLLIMGDAKAWRKPGRRTTRVDFVAVKGEERLYRTAFKNVEAAVKRYDG